uniref:TRP C-terminal domain-containing protein n=1 Tax=Amphimedon queenslandica TaxID=400682 RepID=A0A1X7V0E5_AMPQE
MKFCFALSVLLVANIALSSAATDHYISSNEELWHYLCSSDSPVQDNTTLYLTKGTYELKNTAGFCILRDVQKLKIQSLRTGQTSLITCLSTIRDISTVGFGFVNVTGIELHNIKFKGCGAILTLEAIEQMNETHPYFFYEQKATLAFNHCKDMNLVNIIIHYYIGYAVLLMNPLGTSNGIRGMSIMYGIFISRSSCHSGTNICSGSGLMCLFKDTNTTFELATPSEFCRLPLLGSGGITIIFNQTFGASFTSTDTILDVCAGSIAGSSLILYYNGMFNSRVSFFSIDAFNLIHMPDSLQEGGNGIAVYSFLCGQCPVTETSLYKTPLLIKDSFVRGTGSYDAVIKRSHTKYSSNLFLNIFEACGPSKLLIILERVRFRWSYASVSGSATYAFISHKLKDSTSASVSLVFSKILARECAKGNNIYGIYSNVPCFTFINWNNVTISGGRFWENNAPVIAAYNSEVYLTGAVSFERNKGVNGPAVYLQSSYLVLQEPLNASFIRNAALLYGGAVYAHNIPAPVTHQRCALQVKPIHQYTNDTELNINLHFMDNKAGLAGVSMYIVPLYNCSQIFPSLTNPSRFNWSSITTFKARNPFKGLQEISSGPFKICSCSYSNDATSLKISCSYNEVSSIIHSYPGMMISVPLCAVDSSGSIVYSAAVASINNDKLTKKSPIQNDLYLLHHQTLSPLSGQDCTYVSYNVYSRSNTLRHSLFSVAIPFSSPSWSAYLFVHPCPLGFVLNQGECICDPLLTGLIPNIHCNISNTSISLVTDGQWMGNASNSLGLSFVCPPTNCQRGLSYLNMTDPSSLCTDTKEGVLCSQCRIGLSVVFGTSQCLECSSIWLLSLFGYALSGIVLVAIMLYLPLTISEGPLAGIIIAMNITAASTFDLQEERQGWFLYVVRVCVSVVNLSLGFPLCFYDGMTPLIKTGLLFAYPIYLWILIIGFIIFSHFSTRVSNKTAMHSVQVLASLMYLSFSKILMTIIDIIAYIPVHTSSSSGTVIVWYGDGSVLYLSNNGHILLFTFSLLALLLYIFPFIVFVTFGQWLLRVSLINKYMRQYIEAFQGPYKHGKGYWFGLRVILVSYVYMMWSLLRGYSLISMLFLQFIPILLFCVSQSLFRPFRSKVLNGMDTICLLLSTLQIVLGISFARSSANYYLYCIGFINNVLFLALMGTCLVQLLKKSRFASWILLNYSTKKHVKCRQEKDDDETDEARRLLADLPDEEWLN